MASSRPSTSATTGCSMSAMARGVKAAGDDRRTRVCSGGSLKTRLVVWCSIEQAVAVLGRELALLVGGEGGRVLVDGDAVGVAGQEIAAVGQPVHRARARAARDRWDRDWRSRSAGSRRRSKACDGGQSFGGIGESRRRAQRTGFCIRALAGSRLVHLPARTAPCLPEPVPIPKPPNCCPTVQVPRPEGKQKVSARCIGQSRAMQACRRPEQLIGCHHSGTAGMPEPPFR